MVLHAYFDESGTNPTHDAFVLAGYMFTPEHSRPFSLEWQDLMEKWGLRHFHMVDFEAGYGPYADWRKDGVHEERLNQLLDLILKYATAGFAVALPDENFREVYGADANPDLKYLIVGR